MSFDIGFFFLVKNFIFILKVFESRIGFFQISGKRDFYFFKGIVQNRSNFYFFLQEKMEYGGKYMDKQNNFGFEIWICLLVIGYWRSYVYN